MLQGLSVSSIYLKLALAPLTWLCSCRINQPVVIRLKWGNTQYKGRLVSVDSYMNIQLSETVEHIDGKPTGTLGMVLIRWVFSCSVFVSCAILYD